MRFVFANKFHYLKGGAERYALGLAALLEKHGHEVAPFAMRGRNDLPTAWQRYFVSPIETERVGFGWQGLRTAGRFLYSFEAKRKFSRLLEAFKPDLVHVHNIYHQISPSILPAAKKRGLPVVMTVHDYALLAPNYTLFHDGRICEVTKPDAFWNAVGHRCVKGSRAASALAAAELSLHRWLGLYADNIDRYIAPSRFVQALLGEYGLPPEKAVYLPHYIDASAWQPAYEGGYALFVGRLSAEKGAAALIRAAAEAKHVPVRIVGTGPEEASLRSLAAKYGASNVEFRGFKEGAELAAEYAGARFVVVPSVWYEVFGLTVLEAYAAGKPVIASQIGGLEELVRDGRTGLLTSAGETAALARALDELWSAPAECAAMGREARAWVEQDFTPEAHYQAIMKIYAEAASAGKKQG